MADPQPEEGLEQFIAVHEAGTEAFNRGDLDAAMAPFPDDIEWHAVSDDPESSVLRGPQEIKNFFEGFREVFDEWRSEPVEYEQLGDATALVHHVLRGTSRGAGVPVEVDTWELWDFDPATAQAHRVRQFFTRDEAVAAFEAG